MPPSPHVRRWRALAAAAALALALLAAAGACDGDGSGGNSGASGDVAERYARYCAACHGVDGETVEGMPAVPYLAGQGLLTTADDAFLFASIAHGRPGENGRGQRGTKMSAFHQDHRGPFDDAQIEALVAYVRAWQTEPSVDLDASWRTNGDPDAGRERYLADCAECHGEDGWGEAAPRLAGQTLQAAASDDFLRQTILRGRPGTLMRAFDYDDEAVADVVAYVRTLGAAPAAEPASSSGWSSPWRPRRAHALEASAADAPSWHLAATWQASPQAPPGGVIDPVDLDIGADGSVYVLDRGLNRVQRFRERRPDAAFGGGVGLAPGVLASPLGVAVDDATGRLLVSDTEHGEVARFDLATGEHTAWPGMGRPESIAVGLDGLAYVYERERNGISGRTDDGAEDLLFPVQRALSFIAELPRGLAISPSGNVFFAAENPVANNPNVLYEFTARGEVVPPRTALSWQIFDLAFDQDRLWLLDGTDARLVGDLDRARGQSGRGVPVRGGARALAAGAPGRLALLYGATSVRPAGLVELATDGASAREVAAWDFPPLDPSWLPAPQRLAWDDGDLIVADGTERAVALGPERIVRGVLARPGLHDALRLPGGDWLVVRSRFAATYDPKDDPDVAEPGTRRVRLERYPAAGGADAAPLATWTWEHVEAVEALPVTTLTSLVHDPATGLTHALDAGGGRVFVVGPDGAAMGEIALPVRPGFPRWVDLVRLPDGAVAALHGGARELHRIGDEALPPVALDVPGTPLRLDAGAEGQLVVVTAEREVAVLAADGSLLQAWSLPEPAVGDLEPPSDVAAAADGTIAVSDRAGMAIHRFEPGVGPVQAAPLILPALAR